MNSDDVLLIVIGVILIFVLAGQLKNKFMSWQGPNPELSVATDYLADGPSRGMTNGAFRRFGGDSLLQLNYILRGERGS